MGIFDFFTREVTDGKGLQQGQDRRAIVGKPINSREANGGAVQLFHPRSFDDVQNIIEMLKHNRSVIVYLSDLKHEDGQRVIDMLAGAAFALEGSILPIENNIYMVTLDGITVGK